MCKIWNYLCAFAWFMCAFLLTTLHAINAPKNKADKKYKVVIVNHKHAFGEAQAVENIVSAADNIGWECVVVLHSEFNLEKIKSVQPNFIISLREEAVPIDGYINFLYLHVPMYMYLNKNGALCPRAYPNVLKYQGFLNVVPDASPVKAAFETQNKKPFYSIQTVFSVKSRDFYNAPKTRLCYSGGSLWDEKRAGTNYKQIYHLLDQTGYLDIYGSARAWEKMRLKSYRGLLPMDDHSVVDAISNCGIALVLHSNEHIRGQVPTSRIFEAAAASAVIICDHHPFVEKEFGDSVLYIDPNQTPDGVFKQIDNHVKWVHDNPEQAIALARRAHTLFMERFTLESELQKIAAMYERMVQ